ncbi:unnamed protein product [Zymoseptoria tritici ST99CH_3D1]|uniref:Uncharacterized protein n=2 Tax=Zymoseptoria tritici TaxID=1047171 RepID=F9XE63_ZYMTI|nr:uncharacterized protein MYCGRDRAFT_94102 [Zymoseptoria tritici IPO323]EGP86703.1 hypothetical protein MYCGRDRAFT_94102 [Zymoseptoria tritici IPO323]SMR54584.1 unnamed protein product [Zymoseptoria tritici ST99CH_1E4]SMR56446.1 unnamed protein product [Zymoseptoria tritici ST99CH_3D1]
MQKLDNGTARLLLQLSTFELAAYSMSEPRAHIRSSSPPQGTPALTTKQQRQATLLLRRIDRALQQDSTHQYDVILRLNEHKRRLEALIPRCRLLELPAEIREGIFILAVTEWGPVPGDDFIEMPPSEVSDARRRVPLLEKRAVRIDRLNRPAPPGLTCVSRQLREETLHLYYKHNTFELWRPLYWLPDWTCSTFIDWLTMLEEKIHWLRDIVLLYKHDDEMEHDLEGALAYEGFQLRPGIITSTKEVSEYEIASAQFGLPKHFGSKKGTSRRIRWIASSGGG